MTETQIIETGGQGGIDIVERLDAQPQVGPEGTIGHQPTQAEIDAYAESRLRSKGYQITKSAPANTVNGTDIPTEFCSQEDWDDMTLSEQKVQLNAWRMAKAAVQRSEEQSAKVNAPLLRKIAIEQISDGLDDRAKSIVPKMVQEIEDETGSLVGALTPGMVKNLQRMARGYASEIKPSPKVGKEASTETIVDETTKEEQEIIDMARNQYGVDWTPERARIFLKGNKTSGYTKEKTSA